MKRVRMGVLSKMKDSPLWPWFKLFAELHKISGDIDPVYPVLRKVHELRNNSQEQSIWHALLYVTWYNLGSAEKVLQRWPLPSPVVMEEAGLIGHISWGGLKTGVERRGFRGKDNEKPFQMINGLLASVWKNYRTLEEWLTETTKPGGRLGWQRLYIDFQGYPGNGTWAAYKWCDLTKNVLGYKITSPDIGLGGGGRNAGPVPGLSLMSGEPWERCARDEEFQEQFYREAREDGLPWDGLEEMETCLCDFNSTYKGTYYLGHDIDKQMEDIRDCPKEYWEARRLSFHPEYLGEIQGWDGVRKDRKPKFKRWLEAQKTITGSDI